MKRLTLVFVIVMVLGLFTVAYAECNPGDQYCQGWTPNQQEQKVRIEDMESYVLLHKDLLNGCDATTKNFTKSDGSKTTCVDNYNDVTGGLFKAVATKNKLPYEQFVKYAIALNYEWGLQAENTYKRPLALSDWQDHYPYGWNELAASLTINNVMWIQDSVHYCVAQEYGGVCPGKY